MRIMAISRRAGSRGTASKSDSRVCHAKSAHDSAQVTEAFRRAVLRLLARRGLFEREDAEAMLALPRVGSCWRGSA